MIELLISSLTEYDLVVVVVELLKTVIYSFV